MAFFPHKVCPLYTNLKFLYHLSLIINFYKFSGPKRYDYVPSKDGWYYSRDGQSIESLLDNELSDTLGKEVKVGVEHISDKVA